jgi:hypothetical protein
LLVYTLDPACNAAALDIATLLAFGLPSFGFFGVIFATGMGVVAAGLPIVAVLLCLPPPHAASAVKDSATIEMKTAVLCMKTSSRYGNCHERIRWKCARKGLRPNERRWN